MVAQREHRRELTDTKAMKTTAPHFSNPTLKFVGQGLEMAALASKMSSTTTDFYHPEPGCLGRETSSTNQNQGMDYSFHGDYIAMSFTRLHMQPIGSCSFADLYIGYPKLIPDKGPFPERIRVHG